MGVSDGVGRRWEASLRKLSIGLCYGAMVGNAAWVVLIAYVVLFNQMSLLTGLTLMALNAVGVLMSWTIAKSIRARAEKPVKPVRIEPRVSPLKGETGEIQAWTPQAVQLEPARIAVPEGMDVQDFRRHWESLSRPVETVLLSGAYVSADVLALSSRVTPELLALPIPTAAREILEELRALGAAETGEDV